jgi:hypothetical protein
VRDSDHEDHKVVSFLATKRHKKAQKGIEEWSHFFFESGTHELRKVILFVIFVLFMANR